VKAIKACACYPLSGPRNNCSNRRAPITLNLHDGDRRALNVVRALSTLINVAKHAKVGDSRGRAVYE
jgi:hypothetical protein